MVFQSYALFPHLSVAENIVFGLKVRRTPQAERKERLARVAELVGLTEQLARKPAQLSGGQRQRVALARAVIAENRICLMDEPLSNLDAQLRHGMRVEIRALQQRLGMTVVYVTHDQVEAMSMADRVILMREGRIEQEGTPEELYARPATTFAASFIGTPPMNLVALADGPGGAVVRGAPQARVLPGRGEGTHAGGAAGAYPARRRGRRAGRGLERRVPRRRYRPHRAGGRGVAARARARAPGARRGRRGAPGLGARGHASFRCRDRQAG
jgi:sn-glycerol 3-phosphate transport system ATP-binding protein